MISALITILMGPLMLRWEETQDRGSAVSTQLDSVEAETWIQVICLPCHCGPHWATAGGTGALIGVWEKDPGLRDGGGKLGQRSKWPLLCSFHRRTRAGSLQTSLSSQTLPHARQPWKTLQLPSGEGRDTRAFNSQDDEEDRGMPPPKPIRKGRESEV